MIRGLWKFLRDNFLVLVLIALLFAIWIRLDSIERTIPYVHDAPQCDLDRPCHVIIEKSKYP